MKKTILFSLDSFLYFTMEAVKQLLGLKISDLAEDLLPLFEQRSFITAWLESFRENFREYAKNY